MYKIPISASEIEMLTCLGSKVITWASMYSEKELIVDINHYERLVWEKARFQRFGW